MSCHADRVIQSVLREWVHIELLILSVTCRPLATRSAWVQSSYSSRRSGRSAQSVV